MVAAWVPGSGSLKGPLTGREASHLYSRKHLCGAAADSAWNSPAGQTSRVYCMQYSNFKFPLFSKNQ